MKQKDFLTLYNNLLGQPECNRCGNLNDPAQAMQAGGKAGADWG